MNSSPSISRARSGSPTFRALSKIAQLSSLPPLNASGQSNVSPATPSLTNSPTETSVQSSPDTLHPRSIPQYCQTPIQLPESAITSPLLIPNNSYSESSPLPGKPGLMRRVSRSAKNAPTRLLRHRQSSNSVADRDRDQSSGPLVMRRQNSAENEDLQSIPDLSNLNFQLPESLVVLPNNIFQEVNYRSGTTSASPYTRGFIEQDDSYGIVNKTSKVDISLLTGTRLTKVTGKKRKEFNFVLDPSSVKISWHPSNSMKRLYIDDILEIRKQSEAANYRQELGVSDEFEDRWFTIIYTDPNRMKGRPTKTMHLVAPDTSTFNQWITNLERIIDMRQRTMQLLASGKQGNYDKILPELWRREMNKLSSACSSQLAATKDSIDYLGVQTVCRSLHMDCDRDWLKRSFDEADNGRTGSINYEQFRLLFAKLKERSEIHEIYQTLVDPGAQGISLYSFFNFLKEVQGIDTSVEEGKWAKVFSDHVHQFGVPKPESPTSSVEETMDLEAFTSFLSSAANDTLRTMTQPRALDKPLSQYFISSSHNTYLMGRQVAGMSSTEAYVIALKKGCRCVEIDCWDGDNGQPIVTHGRTMTSQVSFQDCISAIAKYAFVKTPYPLILSLEVHCNPLQQQIMRNIMEKEFGAQLVKKPINDSQTLPSPEELKYRVLVKVKAHTPEPLPATTSPLAEGRVVVGRQRSLSSPQAGHSSMALRQLPPLSSPPTLAPLDLSVAALSSRPSFGSLNHSSTEDSDSNFGTAESTHPMPKPPKSKIVKNLGELGVYTSGFKFRSFNFPEAKHFNHIFSLVEGDFENLCGPENVSKLEGHNARYLMRVYPARKRIRSSNFNPLLCWRRGGQMAALNWQTYDLGMQLNDAMFASEADSRGYVLKPEEVYPAGSDGIEDLAGRHSHQKQRIRFSLELISGQQLPRPQSAHPDMVSSPYVEIELLCAEDKKLGIASGEGGQDASRSGVSGIGAPHRRRSRVVEKNGYNPQFRETFKLSLETRYPSLVFVRWSVWSSPDGRNPSTNATPLATFTAKLSDLEQGYRHLPLYDNNGEKLLSSLFCRIMKEQPTLADDSAQDEREGVDKPGRLKTITQALKRSLSSKESRSRTLGRRASGASSRRQSKDKSNDINDSSTL